MTVHARIRRGSYYDSVALLQAQRALRELPGVEEAGVVMGTPANVQLLREAGLDAPELDQVGPDDLLVVVRARSTGEALRALERIDELLTRREEPAASGYQPKTVRAAARLLPGANLAVVSVPGRFAAGVAEEALREGLHVFLFSDNVPVQDEIRLKELAAERGLLVMGPDCGTALVGGVGLGFANAVRRGSVGIVAAAGTGLQEVTSLIHRWGGGVSHGLGTGGRDLQKAVGGRTAAVALGALAQDPQTQVVVVVSKPPSPSVAARLVSMAEGCGKPVVLAFVGAAAPPPRGNLYFASTLEEAAALALRLSGAEPPEFPDVPDGLTGRWDGPRWVRGLFSGGTLCVEAQVVLRERLGRVWSNAPITPEAALEDPLASREHTVLDLGADEFTAGRLHPMLDPSVRAQRMLREAADAEVGVLLVDVVLGFGSHPDPAGELAQAWEQARRVSRPQQRELVCVASVCGTDSDPQEYSQQVQRLQQAGVLVAPTNAAAARWAAALAAPEAPRQQHLGLTTIPVTEEPQELPAPPEPVRQLLRGPLRVVNVGLEQFAHSLRSQGVPVVSVDWRPPARGDAEMLDLLARLGG